MKKLSRQLYIVLFFLLCLVPIVGMLLGFQSKAAAHEIQSRMPTSLTEDGHFRKTVLNEISAYLDDHFAARLELNTAWAKINASVFRSSVDDQIVVGKNGWLYYSPTVPDFLGKSLTDEELRAIAENLFTLQSGIEKGGSQFIFTIAPNKNSLYGANMPSAYKDNHGQSTAERLKPYLDEYGIHYVDLFETFSANSKTLYYATDSHWTEEGAALAADRILTAAGKTMLLSMTEPSRIKSTAARITATPCRSRQTARIKTGVFSAGETPLAFHCILIWRTPMSSAYSPGEPSMI